MSWRAAVAVAWGTLAWAGCSSTPPTIGDPAPTLANTVEERRYREVLARYSGQAEIYARLDTHLFAGATFLTWPMREARAMRLASFKAMTDPERAALLLAERDAHQAAHEVVLGVWVVDSRFDDFDRKDSIWRVALVSGTTEVLPQTIERVGRVDLNLRALYPYMGEFWVAYRVRFPRVLPDGGAVVPPGTQAVTLRLASTLGKAELVAAAE
jgi:hypothetical protein